MAPTDPRKRIRIFLSSPGDVAEERRLAARADRRQAAQGPRHRPLLRPGAGRAGRSRTRPRRWTPSARPRTPSTGSRASLPSATSSSSCSGRASARPSSSTAGDGHPAPSGSTRTPAAPRKPPHLLVYRRTAKPQIDLDAPDFDAKRAQLDAAEAFLAGMRWPYQRLRAARRAGPPPRIHLRELLAKFGAPSGHRLPSPARSSTASALAPLAPAAFRAGAEALIASYLGTPEHPVAFGGRAAMLQRLDAWLADLPPPPAALGAGRPRQECAGRSLARRAGRALPSGLPADQHPLRDQPARADLPRPGGTARRPPRRRAAGREQRPGRALSRLRHRLPAPCRRARPAAAAGRRRPGRGCRLAARRGPAAGRPPAEPAHPRLGPPAGRATSPPKAGCTAWAGTGRATARLQLEVAPARPRRHRRHPRTAATARRRAARPTSTSPASSTVSPAAIPCWWASTSRSCTAGGRPAAQ